MAFLKGSSFKPSGDNLSVFDNWIHEPAYLSGMAGGYAIPDLNQLVAVFMDGSFTVVVNNDAPVSDK